MKLIIFALAAVAASLTHIQHDATKASEHAVKKENVPGITSLCNHEGKDTFHMVTRTDEGTTYQPWYSTDQKNWQKYETPFPGNGNLRIISIHEPTSSAAGVLFIKLEKQ